MGSGERLAVIDLGSNSFRLVVFTAREGWWQRTDEIYEPVRIGEGMAASGRLGEEPIRRALATLEVFAHFCEASGLGPETVDAVATSAIRDAENAGDFLGMAGVRTGLPIRVLSGEAEARYGYLAAINSTTLHDGCVLDLGGGSLQLVRVADRLLCESNSWRVGAVRMTERFLPGEGIPKQKQLDELREHVAGELESAAWLPQIGGRMVGIGGTVRNLAAAAQRCAGLPSNGVQGMLLSAEALERLVVRLAELPASERSRVPGIKPARADLILAGAMVVQEALRASGLQSIEITEAGLREGVFFERLLSDRQPPLFEDVRRSSVLNIARRYRVDIAHTRHVAKLALSMFDQLAELGLHPGDPRERELLWAACELHDIGMSVDYDDHHKHSRYLILNGALPGFSPVEVALIAQAARYHRKGTPDPGPLASLFGDGDQERLRRLAVLLRLAEDLERSRDQLVREVRLTLAGEGAQEHQAERPQVWLELVVDGEAAVPRWAAGRETGLFARAFGRELAVV